MNKHITITTNHIEFEQIIINSDLNILEDIQAENLSKEETKNYIIFGRDDMSQALNRQYSKIYSIKDSTDGKSDVEIVEIIRNELEIFNDEEFVWNKMIYAISQVNLCEVPKPTGKRIWN